jgi:hypothetical protein
MFRAVYGAADITDTIKVEDSVRSWTAGIDAWLDTSRGRAELEEIRRVSGESKIGVRMHSTMTNIHH